MEEAVVGAVIGATLQVVLQNLLTISKEQVSLVQDFKKDLGKTRDSFLMVHDFLYESEMQQVTDRAIKRWLRKKVKSFFSDNPIAYRIKLARRIKDINEKLELINREARDFGLPRRFAGARAPVSGFGSGSDAYASMETDSYSVDPIILGREDDVSRIVEMLITTSPDEQTLISVLPVVGMGGLGKTTLARKVFGHERIISH